jgi:hypothetical protein
MNGYVSNARIVKGVAVYTGTFTPQGPLSRIQSARTNVAALSGSETTLLTLQNTTIIDNSYYNAITYISPTPTYYASFNGTSQYLTVAPNAAFAFGTGDFTIEYWIYWTVSGGSRVLTNRLDRAAAGGTWSVSMGDTYLNFTEVVAGEPGVSSSFSSIAGKWAHIAICRISGTTTIYLNGSSVGSGSQTTNFSNSSYNLNIGWSPNENYVTANISNVRIIKGQAVYTNNFTPSGPLTITSQGAVAANVSLLTLQNATIIDNSTANGGVGFTVNNTTSVTTTYTPNNIITNVNTVTTIASVSVFGSTPPTTNDYLLLTDNTTSNQALAPIGSVTVTASGSTTTAIVPVQTYSVQFTGSQYLIVSNTSVSNFGTGDFTVETWINPTTASGSFLTNSSDGGAINNNYWVFSMNTSGASAVTWSFQIRDGAGQAYVFGSIATPLNSWAYIAVTRSSGLVRLYVNGVFDNSATITKTVTARATCIGSFQYLGYSDYFNGYLSSSRITNGTALYTGSTMSVPTAPTIIGTNTTLLTCQSATIVDNSTANGGVGYPITNNNNATVSSTIIPSFTTTATVGTASNSYILSVPRLNVSNLNINNSWTAQLWDPEVIPQLKYNTILPPNGNTRANLFYATNFKNKYGKLDSSTILANSGAVFYSKTDGLVFKNKISGIGKGISDPSAPPKAPVQFWN